MQSELMELYQKNGYSQFAGCLPMLVQIIIIFPLYWVVVRPLQYCAGLSQETCYSLANALGMEFGKNGKPTLATYQVNIAERLASGPGNKAYGILSVLLQAWYNIEYLFTVPEHVFVPPPKVKSGVIRLTRNSRTSLGCDEVLFKKVVKTCFNQRRKTIRNSIKPILAETGKNFTPENTPEQLSRLFELRPEQLSVEQFVELTLLIS